MGSYGFSEEDVERLMRRPGTPEAIAAVIKTAKRQKYNAQPTEIDGHVFPSQREARRYGELKLLQQAGEISRLEIQPQFPLMVTNPAGILVTVARYSADFKYIRDGATVIEDAKGFRTNTAYLLRKRLVEAQYGVSIVEV